MGVGLVSHQWLDSRAAIPEKRRGDAGVAPTIGRKDDPGEEMSNHFGIVKLFTRQYVRGYFAQGSRIGMPNPDLSIIVCVDQRRCKHLRLSGRNGPELLEELKTAIEDNGLKERVQVTHCQYIFGCREN